MHERYQAGIVHQSMEPQSEAITARPESGRSDIPEKRSSQLIKRAKNALENSKAKGVRSFAAATILASSILGACKFENENGNPPPPGLTPIERTLPPGVATSNPNPTELPTVIVTPITPIEGTEKPNPTETPGTETPTATETVVETPTVTETPSVTPTPETPTPTETPVESELPYEIGWEMTVGNVTLAVTKDMQERTECESLYGNGKVEACKAMSEFYLNTEDYPDASERLQEAVRLGLYTAWINQGQEGSVDDRKETSFEQFKEELTNGEGKDFSFFVTGLRNVNGKNVSGLIKIDPRNDRIGFVWLRGKDPSSEEASENAYTIINEAAGLGVREANDENGRIVYLEIDSWASPGEASDVPEKNWFPSRSAASTNIEISLAYLGDSKFQIPSFTTGPEELVKEMTKFDNLLVPDKSDINWNGVVRAK